MRRKLACLAQQNKGNVAWLFFRNTFLEIHGQIILKKGKKVGENTDIRTDAYKVGMKT